MSGLRRRRRRPVAVERAFAIAGALCLLGAGPAGCVTESITTGDGLPRASKPLPVRVPPSGLQPREMVLIVAPSVRDADGDGYPDTLSATAYLTSESDPLMITAPGSFEFDVWREGTHGVDGASPIARWTFDDAAVASAKVRTMAGWGHSFTLSLLDAGVTDRMPMTSGDLRARFRTPEGIVIDVSDDVRPVRLGR